MLATYQYTYGSGAEASTFIPNFLSSWTSFDPSLPFHDPSQIRIWSLGRSFPSADLLTSVVSVDGTAQYAYDPLRQLISASYSGGQANESYTWDANGNLSGTDYVVGAGNRLLSDGTYRYVYDAEGNRTAKFIDADHNGLLNSGDTDITQYTWDTRNRLVKVTDRATFGGNITQIVDYLYDAENRWIGEQLDSDGDGVIDHQTRFIYDGNQIVLQFEKDGSSAMSGADLAHRYVWQPDAVDQVLADERTHLDGGGIVTDEVLWPLADNLGTVRDVAKLDAATGATAVVDHVIYDSFGKVVSESDPAAGSLFGFTGRPTSKTTGLRNHLNRWNDPQTADWLSEDPNGLTAGDTNTRRYCGNSPLNATDPSGLDSGDEKTIHLSNGKVILGPEAVRVAGDNIEIDYWTNAEGATTFWFPIKQLKAWVKNPEERAWLRRQAGLPPEPMPVTPPPRTTPPPISTPAAAVRDEVRDRIGRPTNPAFNETAEMLQNAHDTIVTGGVFVNEFVVKPYVGGGMAIGQNILGTIEGVEALGKSLKENGVADTVLKTGKGVYTVVATFNQWAPAAAKQALDTLLGDDNVAKGALAANIFMLAMPAGEGAGVARKVSKALKAGEAISLDEAKMLIRKSHVLQLDEKTGKLTRVSGKGLTAEETAVLANKLIVQEMARAIKEAITKGKKLELTVDNLEQAIQAVRLAMPDAVELPRAVKGQPYPSPSNTKKWFQIHPAEPGTHELPHVKWADWTQGKRDRGGSYGSVYFKVGG